MLQRKVRRELDKDLGVLEEERRFLHDLFEICLFVFCLVWLPFDIASIVCYI